MPATTARLYPIAADLLARMPKEGPIRAQKNRAFLRSILKGLDRRITLDGGDMRETEDGIHIRLSLQTPDDPWTVHVAGEFASIAPGSIDNRIPTVGVGGVRLDSEPAPMLAISEGELQYIYVKCAFDYTIEDQAGRNVVTDITLLSAVVMASILTASQLDDPENGFFHLLIATISASGNVTAQPHKRSLATDFTINVPPLGVLVQFV